MAGSGGLARAHDQPVAFAIRDIGELHGLREVYVQGDYDVSLGREPGVVLDLGGNIGAATVYFASRWPGAQIVVVEPDLDPLEHAVLARYRRREPAQRRARLSRLAVAARG